MQTNGANGHQHEVSEKRPPPGTFPCRLDMETSPAERSGGWTERDPGHPVAVHQPEATRRRGRLNAELDRSATPVKKTASKMPPAHTHQPATIPSDSGLQRQRPGPRGLAEGSNRSGLPHTPGYYYNDGFRVPAPSCLHGRRRGVSRGSGAPVRCVAAYPPAIAAAHPARTVPGAAFTAPPGCSTKPKPR